mgnify:CR=1 FL=1
MGDDLYERGLAIRKATLGRDYVEDALARADAFSMPLQRLVTEYAWGAVWGRETLPPKLRSLLNLALLTALNRPHELRLHVRGALNNGCTPEEKRRGQRFLVDLVRCWRSGDPRKVVQPLPRPRLPENRPVVCSARSLVRRGYVADVTKPQR